MTNRQVLEVAADELSHLMYSRADSLPLRGMWSRDDGRSSRPYSERKYPTLINSYYSHTFSD